MLQSFPTSYNQHSLLSMSLQKISWNNVYTIIYLFQMQNSIRWWNVQHVKSWVNRSLKTKSSDLWSFWSNVRNSLNCNFHLKSWISIYKVISSLKKSGLLIKVGAFLEKRYFMKVIDWIMWIWRCCFNHARFCDNHHYRKLWPPSFDITVSLSARYCRSPMTRRSLSSLF